MHFYTAGAQQMAIAAASVDLQNNTLLNVGHAGNDWTASRLTMVGRLDISNACNDVNSKAMFETTRTGCVACSATTIYNQGASSPQGVFLLVQGRRSDTSNNKFLDIVLNGRAGTPQVVSSYVSDGSSASRTYTNGGENTRLAMGDSNAMDITVFAIAMPNVN